MIIMSKTPAPAKPVSRLTDEQIKTELHRLVSTSDFRLKNMVDDKISDWLVRYYRSLDRYNYNLDLTKIDRADEYALLVRGIVFKNGMTDRVTNMVPPSSRFTVNYLKDLSDDYRRLRNSYQQRRKKK